MKPSLGNGKVVAGPYIVPVKKAPQGKPRYSQVWTVPIKRVRMLFPEHFGLNSS